MSFEIMEQIWHHHSELFLDRRRQTAMHKKCRKLKSSAASWGPFGLVKMPRATILTNQLDCNVCIAGFLAVYLTCLAETWWPRHGSSTPFLLPSFVEMLSQYWPCSCSFVCPTEFQTGSRRNVYVFSPAVNPKNSSNPKFPRSAKVGSQCSRLTTPFSHFALMFTTLFFFFQE